MKNSHDKQPRITNGWQELLSYVVLLAVISIIALTITSIIYE